jgi:hypothetical protein
MPVDDDVKSLEYLMDVITQVPLLLQRSNEMINSKTVHLEHLSALLIAFRQIMTWQQWCKRSSTTPLYWAVPSNIHNPADDGYPSQLFPFSIEYEGLNVAMLFVFSSAVMLQLLSAAHLLITTNDVLSDKINKLASTERAQEDQPEHREHTNLESEQWSLFLIRSEADRIACFLCQSTEYCFRYEMGTVGPQAMCHPQFAMRNYFCQVGKERELEWCENIKDIDGHGVRRGIKMMMFGNYKKEGT